MFKKQLIPNIPPNSFIIMDNAIYHSLELNKTPTSNSLKADMQQWLQDKKHVVKLKLYKLVKLYKLQFKTYEVDKMAEEFGHSVIRLPP